MALLAVVAINVIMVASGLKDKYVRRIEQRTAANIASMIVNEVRQTGVLVVNTPEGQLVLVPQKKTPGLKDVMGAVGRKKSEPNDPNEEK